MSVLKLPKRIVDIISKRIGATFDAVKGKFLGPRSLDKHLFIAFDPVVSLPGMYEAASRVEGGVPDTQALSTLVDTSKNYIDALKLKTVNKVVKDIEEHLAETSEVTPETIEKALKESWKETTSNLKTIVDTEIQATKNMALINGIIQMNASMGIDDPHLFFVIVRDEDVCEECMRVHMLPDRVTPRVFLLSEIGRGYHKKGGEFPSMWGLHPSCRCQCVSILPGWGFGPTGRVKYIKKGHMELERQRSELSKTDQYR
jgi:hypothetical protein